MAENNHLIKDYFEEEYGVRVQPVIDAYPMENYTKISSDSIVSTSALLRDLPFFAAQINAENKVTGAYKVIFDRGLGTLQQSAANPDRLRANIVEFGSNNHVVGQAELEEFRLKVTSPALAVFEVAAILTSQYYLSRIDKNLISLHKELKNIERMLENSKESELRSYERGLQSVLRNLTNILSDETYRKSALDNVMRIRMSSLSLVEYYYRERVNVLETWSEEKSKKALYIQESLGKYQNKLDLYGRSFHVFALAYVLEVLLSRITTTENTDRAIEEIQAVYQEYSQEYELPGSDFRIPDKKDNDGLGLGYKAATFVGGAITGFAGPVGLPVLGLVMGSYWIGNSIKDRKTEKALQEYQEIKRHLLQIEESYVRNDIIEEKTVSALETLDCLYNKKVELLINGDEIYLKTLEH